MSFVKKVSIFFICLISLVLYSGWVDLCFNSPVIENAAEWHRLQEIQMVYAGAFRLYSTYRYAEFAHFGIIDTTVFWGHIYNYNYRCFRWVKSDYD